jgi:electron transfer flavoprotein alpha subunit
MNRSIRAPKKQSKQQKNATKRTVHKKSSKKMSTLVIADSPSTDIRSTITAAKKIGKPITVLAVNDGSVDATPFSKINGVNKVITVNAKDSQTSPEVMASIVGQVQTKNNFTHIIAPASIRTKDFMPRLAATLDSQPMNDITGVVNDTTFIRNTYAGNAVSTIKSNNKTIFATIRPSAFEAEAAQDGTASVESIDCTLDNINKATFVSAEIAKSDRPDLATAKIVISGGRGMKNGENFQLLYTLAEKFPGAAVGASRAAVDAGFVPNDLQVGQTGKIVAPNLYIAVGISGAIQHLAGMKDSKTIVAINKDADAPIFQIADYGIVADLFDVIPELQAKL